jgi:hypothetical protein
VRFTWIAMAAALFSVSLPAADLFTCKVKENGQTVTVKFGVNTLSDAKKIRLVDVGAGEDEGPVLVSPKWLKNKYMPSVSILNDQGGDVRLHPDYLKLFGDGDGYTYVDLVLYKNSGYTTGYLRVYGSGVKSYQTIACSRARL